MWIVENTDFRKWKSTRVYFQLPCFGTENKRKFRNFSRLFIGRRPCENLNEKHFVMFSKKFLIGDAAAENLPTYGPRGNRIQNFTAETNFIVKQVLIKFYKIIRAKILRFVLYEAAPPKASGEYINYNHFDIFFFFFFFENYLVLQMQFGSHCKKISLKNILKFKILGWVKFGMKFYHTNQKKFFFKYEGCSKSLARCTLAPKWCPQLTRCSEHIFRTLRSRKRVRKSNMRLGFPIRILCPFRHSAGCRVPVRACSQWRFVLAGSLPRFCGSDGKYRYSKVSISIDIAGPVIDKYR